jgi:PAS domain S-box-containing protein
MKQNGSILVVDDEAGVRQFFSECLRQAGYQVTEAATGREGLQKVRESRPDLVLLDVRLPDLGGMDVCQQIKSDANLRDVLVILCSGEAMSSADKVDGLGTGADEYLTKPVDRAELLARIQTLMRLRNTVAALRTSEEHHRRLLDILPDAVLLVQPHGQIISVNSRAVAMLGYDNPPELIEKQLFDLTPAKDHERIKADILVALKAGIFHATEYTMFRKNGATLRVELSATVSNPGNGEPDGLVCVVRDITERKRAEEKIQQLLTLLDQAHDVIIVRDLEERIQYFNQGAERVLGWKAEEVKGRRVTELFFQDAPAFAAAQATLLRTGIWSGELLGFDKNQRPIIFQSRWTLVHENNESVPLVVSIYTDITERKLVEEKLKEQEALSKRILGAALEGFCRLDLRGNYLDVNAAYCRISGYSRDELLSMNISDLDINLPTSELALRHIRHICKSGGERFEQCYRRKDGRTIYVEVFATSLKLRENYIFEFLRDHTARKEAENQLRASEERFRQLTDNLRQVFWMTDVAKSEILYVSPAYEEIWGRTCQSLYASNLDWVEAIHPEDRQRVATAIFTKQTEGQFDEVYRIVRPDGSIRWIQDRAIPVHDESGAVYRIAGLAEDITKRKEGWDALYESEALKSAIMRVALDAIITIDHAGSIIELNSAAEKMFAKARAKLVGQDIAQIIPLSLRPWFQAGLASCFLGKQGPTTGNRVELPVLRTDGNRFYAELAITRIERKGQPAFTLYIRDITQRKRSEEELRSFHRRIIEVQETERLRIAGELHDGINQIIASVKMRLKKVADSLPQLKPAAREILSRCDQLLVKALDENRRIARNLRPSDLDHFGLFAACQNHCDEMQLRCNLKIQCHIDAFSQRLAPEMELNLFRIIQEAIANIEKHAQAQAVKIHLGFKNDSITLKISDDGRGFDLKKNGTRRKTSGGFGLTHMRERAASLGGTFEIQSALKKGTTITVTVPVPAGAKRATLQP